MADIEFQNESVISEDNLDLTLLDIALKHKIPIIKDCDGRGKCTTCRVLILDDLDKVQPRNEIEAKLAQKKGLGDNIRLACQCKINSSIKVKRLVLDDKDIDITAHESEFTYGKLKNFAVLTVRLKQISEEKSEGSPYDLIQILNRFYTLMGEVVYNHFGQITAYKDKCIVAAFGLDDDDSNLTCFDAVLAGLEMLEKQKDLNRYFTININEEFKIGIGLHFGEAVMAEVGHPRQRQISVIGSNSLLSGQIELSNDKVDSNFMISEEVYSFVKDKIKPARKFISKIKQEEYSLYEVTGLSDEGESIVKNIDLKFKTEKEILNILNVRNAPQFLDLAFHDAGTYIKEDNTGGANGSIHLDEEIGLEENIDFAEIILKLKDIKTKLNDTVSWADLIYIAGALAVSYCGGPKIDIQMGRKDSITPSPNRMYQCDDINIEALKNHFYRMGLDDGNLAAIMGINTIGKYKGLAITKDYMAFNNSYYQYLLYDDEDCGFRQSDLSLLDDPQIKKYVELYAIDQDLFFQDFAESYIKMSLLGAVFS